MSSGASAADATRKDAPVWPRFAASLIASLLLHAAFTALLAPRPGARSDLKNAAASTPLAVRLLAPADVLHAPAASIKTQAAHYRRPLGAPAKRIRAHAVPSTRAATEPGLQDTASVVIEPADTTYYAARQLDHYPELMAALDLTFPAGAPDTVSSGYVLLLVLIDAEGRVDDASVVDAAPAGVFDEEATRALVRARFKPAFKDGRAVRSRLIVHVSYGKRD